MRRSPLRRGTLVLVVAAVLAGLATPAHADPTACSPPTASPHRSAS